MFSPSRVPSLAIGLCGSLASLGLATSARVVVLVLLVFTQPAAFAQPARITASNVTLNPGATTITDQPTGAPIPLATADIVVSGGRTLTVNGRHTIRSLEVQSGAVVTHDAGFTFDYSGGAGTDVVNGLWLNVQANPVGGWLMIAPGASIDASRRGFPANGGPGAGGSSNIPGEGLFGSGGGHGGIGGSFGGPWAPGGLSYGSVEQPNQHGSGGGVPGLPGGGTVRLVVGGTLTVEGAIRANGGDWTEYSSPGGAGAGAGGSIWITADTLEGSGTIACNGGSSFAGLRVPIAGGAGGRVAIYARVFSLANLATAFGGSGQRAGAGTVWTKVGGAAVGSLRVANNGVGARTILPTGVMAMDQIVVGGGANLTIDHPVAANRIAVNDGAELNINHPITVSEATVMGTGSRLSHSQGASGGLALTVTGDLSIGNGASIDVSGRGFGTRSGPGAGSDGDYFTCAPTGSGGGHGGVGGRAGSSPFVPIAAGGVSYGDPMQPTHLGSGGGFTTGGPGGGAVRLNVGGTLLIDGTVRADGVRGGNVGGGGSGGSIWMTVASLQGVGDVTANGGNGFGPTTCGLFAGGGGGGRVAMYAGSSTHTGTIAAFGGSGGSGSMAGGAGTIWTKVGSAAVGSLRVVNNGVGARTILPSTLTTIDQLLVAGGAELILDHPVVANAAAIDGPGTKLSHTEVNLAGLNLAVLGNLAIGSGAAIDVSGRGFSVGGPGAGSDGSWHTCAATGSGAGHGGVGGPAGNLPIAAGGTTYGNLMTPTTLGSRGGNVGGAGGGAIRLSVGGTLNVNGAVRANGMNGGIVSGGGSGGSIWIDAGALVGSGGVTATGGAGGGPASCNVFAGNGGGGRIAVYSCQISVPSGTLEAGNGTIYLGPDAMFVLDQPLPRALCSGPVISFTFDVLGATVFSWTRDGQPLSDGLTPSGAVISGSSTRTLTISGALPGDTGVYQAVASSGCGSVTSDPAPLRVLECPCSLADITDVGDTGAGPDGQLTVDDIIAFVNTFGDGTGCPGTPGAACNLADVTDIGDTGAGPDGELTVDDVIAFVNAFGDGC